MYFEGSSLDVHGNSSDSHWPHIYARLVCVMGSVSRTLTTSCSVV